MFIVQYVKLVTKIKNINIQENVNFTKPNILDAIHTNLTKWIIRPLLYTFCFHLNYTNIYVHRYIDKLHLLPTWFPSLYFFYYSFESQVSSCCRYNAQICSNQSCRTLKSHDIPCDHSKAAILKEVNHRIAGLILPPSPSETKRFLPLKIKRFFQLNII
jgi:hypothetical protein